MSNQTLRLSQETKMALSQTSCPLTWPPLENEETPRSGIAVLDIVSLPFGVYVILNGLRIAREIDEKWSAWSAKSAFRDQGAHQILGGHRLDASPRKGLLYGISFTTLAKSANFGKSWEVIRETSTPNVFHQVRVSPCEEWVYVLTLGALYVSRQGSNEWEEVLSFNGSPTPRMAVCPKAPKLLFVSMSGAQIVALRSDQKWQPAWQIQEDERVVDMFCDDTCLYIVKETEIVGYDITGRKESRTVIVTGGDGFFKAMKCRDGTWFIQDADGLYMITGEKIIPLVKAKLFVWAVNPQTGWCYVGGDSKFLFYTKDRGRTWLSFSFVPLLRSSGLDV